MLLINKNTTNNLYLTLNESSEIYSTGGTPFYLFKLEFEQDNGYTTKYFNSSGTSSNQRCNSFSIIESGSTEYYTGNTISLSLSTGQYKYSVYEQLSSSNLSTSGLNQVETGRLFVKEANNNLNQYYI